MTVKILVGDVFEQLAKLPDESVHCAITSPPYWSLRSYLDDDHELKKYEIGLEPSMAEHIEVIVKVFEEVKRVLRKDGVVFMNYGDSYAGTPNGRSAKDTKELGVDDRTFRDKPISTVGPILRHREDANTRGQRDSTTLEGGKIAPPCNRPKSVVDAGDVIKAKDLLMLPNRIAIALQDAGWWVRSEIIWVKCLSGGTIVYARTQKGDMPMMIKDMVRLNPSTVQLWNGRKWTQVMSFERSEAKEAHLEIEFRSGERVGCTANHVWPTHRGNLRADELRRGDVVRTCDLPEPESPVSPSMLPDEDIGWFVGNFLADGSWGKKGKAINIDSHVKKTDRIVRLEKIARDYGGSFSRGCYSDNGTTMQIHCPVLAGVLQMYLSGNDAYTKHLSVKCWQRSNAFLIALLDGYLCGDGYWDAKVGRWKLGFTNNDNLATDLRTLCARIGAKIRLKRCKHKCQTGVYPGWRGTLKFECTNHGNTKHEGEVMAIRKSRARQFWDIAVADEPHLFALASGILTHNSSPMPESAKDRPTNAHEKVWMLTKHSHYYYDAEAVRVDTGKETLFTGGVKNKGWASSENYVGQDARHSIREKTSVVQEQVIRGHNMRNVLKLAHEPNKDTHFATFPSKLVEPFIKAATSEFGVCPECGAPWKRIIEKGFGVKAGAKGKIIPGVTPHLAKSLERNKGRDRAAGFAVSQTDHNVIPENTTLGWEQTCDCETTAPVPATVLDPFGGSGTTALVADRLKRDAILIELSPDYVEIAKKRIQGDSPLFVNIEVEGE